MGQRHQIFVNCNLRGEKITNGFHHPWLLGFQAIQNLKQMIEWELKNDTYTENKEETNYFSLHGGKFTYHNEDLKNMLKSVISLNFDTGSYRIIENLKTKNPYEVDNNDGQTFIDFYSDSKKPLYGFAFPYIKDNKIEIMDDNDIVFKTDYIINSEKNKELPPFIILSARDYMYKCYGRDIYDNDKIDKEFVEEIEKVLTYIEENTQLMEQEHFEELYKEELKDDISTVAKRIKLSKKIKSEKKNEVLKVLKAEKNKIEIEKNKKVIKNSKKNSNSELSEVTFY